jgi:hypothetical protein
MAMRERKRDQLTTASAIPPGLPRAAPSLRSRRNTLAVSCSEYHWHSLSRRTKSECDRLDALRRFRTCTYLSSAHRAHQIRRWCDGVAVSPKEMLKKPRLKQLLA